MHCVSAYPASPISCNLKSIDYLRKKFRCPVGWSDHTVNPLIIYDAIKLQKAEIIELHFDLEGHGWEEKEGNHHCWLPKDLKKMISYIENEKLVMGSFKKKYSLAEKNERKFRADPFDGLRPLKSLEDSIIMKKKRILIIGGAGFIGHNLALKLKKLKYNVSIADSLQINNILWLKK